MDINQLLPIILGLVGVVFGGWRDRVANKAVAERKTAEASAEQMTADADQQKMVTRLAARMQRLVEQQREDRIKDGEAARAELARISGLFSDIRNGEANIHTTLNNLTALQTQMVSAVNSIPAQVTQTNGETLKLLAAEMAATLKQHLAHDKLDRELYPFPANDDPRWTRTWITPVVPEVTIHKDHRFSDSVKLQKPCATINPLGEEVMLIEATDIACLMVVKEDCYGFLPRHTVKIGR